MKKIAVLLIDSHHLAHCLRQSLVVTDGTGQAIAGDKETSGCVLESSEERFHRSRPLVAGHLVVTTMLACLHGRPMKVREVGFCCGHDVHLRFASLDQLTQSDRLSDSCLVCQELYRNPGTTLAFDCAFRTVCGGLGS